MAIFSEIIKAKLKALLMKWIGLDGTAEDRAVVVGAVVWILVRFCACLLLWWLTLLAHYSILWFKIKLFFVPFFLVRFFFLSPFVFLFVVTSWALFVFREKLPFSARLSGVARLMSASLFGLSIIQALLIIAAVFLIHPEPDLHVFGESAIDQVLDVLKGVVVCVVILFLTCWLMAIVPLTVARVLWRKKVAEGLSLGWRWMYRVGAMGMVSPSIALYAYLLSLPAAHSSEYAGYFILGGLLFVFLLLIPVAFLMLLRSFW